MSLHAQITPDAARILRQQKRNSTLASLTIAIFTIILVALLAAFFLVKGISFPSQPDIIIPNIAPRAEPPRPKPTPISFRQKPSSPSPSSARVLVVNTISNTSIPVPEITTDIPTTDYGSGGDLGEGWGDGTGKPYGAIPGVHKKRCSQKDRLQRLVQSGGNEACEDAVMKSLRWLKKNQNQDGSWGKEKPVAMTGLALLAYLGHCETPVSKEFGSAVTEGMLYLMNNSMQQNGKCASDLRDKHWCYEHAIAVYALSESYLFCKSLQLGLTPQLEEAVQSGTQWILNNQTDAGGWDYAYATDGRAGDSSIVAWHMQALKAAQATGLPFPRLKRSVSQGLDFLANCQNENGGFGYTQNKKPVGSADGHFTLTGAGVLCFQQHKGIRNSAARKGIGYLNDNVNFDFATGQANLYEHYYASQAFLNNSGPEWARYNKLVRDQLLSHQQADGSWPRSTGPGSHPNPVYATTLSTLMLEVYYRYLPGTASK